MRPARDADEWCYRIRHEGVALLAHRGRRLAGAGVPQYKARRLIVEQVKKRYFARQGRPLDEVWWDREVVPIAWIDEQLEDTAGVRVG